jgi:hypothetical protein
LRSGIAAFLVQTRGWSGIALFDHDTGPIDRLSMIYSENRFPFFLIML